MKDAIHFVYIPFSCVGTGTASRRPGWFKERIEVFEKYTLQSLLKQTDRDFVVWLSFRPEDRERAEVLALEAALREKGLNFVMTFDGLMYWDDKFNTDAKSVFLNFLRILRQHWRARSSKWLITDIRTLLSGKNKDLEERIRRSLAFFKPHLPESYLVYLTRLDSDDMLHHDAIKKIKEAPLCEAIRMSKGYIYDVSGKMAEWNPKTNPPFHTIIFPSTIFWDAKRHLEWYRGFKSHEDIPELFDCEVLEERMYCVLTHNPKNHISTIWDHPFRGKVVDNELIKEFI